MPISKKKKDMKRKSVFCIARDDFMLILNFSSLTKVMSIYIEKDSEDFMMDFDPQGKEVLPDTDTKKSDQYMMSLRIRLIISRKCSKNRLDFEFNFYHLVFYWLVFCDFIQNWC